MRRMRPSQVGWLWIFWLAGVFLETATCTSTFLQAWRDLRADVGDFVCSVEGCIDDALNDRTTTVEVEKSQFLDNIAVRRAGGTGYRQMHINLVNEDVNRCEPVAISPLLNSSFVPQNQSVLLTFEIRNCPELLALPHKQIAIRHMKRSQPWNPIQVINLEHCDLASSGCRFESIIEGMPPGTHGFEIRVGEEGKPYPVFFLDVISESVSRILPLKAALNSDVVDRFWPSYRSSIIICGTLGWDGQKRIWLSLFDAIYKHFDLTYITFNHDTHLDLETDTTTFLPLLRPERVWTSQHPGLSLLPPFPVHDRTQLLLMLCKSIKNLRNLNSKSNQCRRMPGELPMCSADLEILIRLNIPSFGADSILRMAGSLDGHDTFLFANSQDVTDCLIIDVARLVGISTIIYDLPNLEAQHCVDPDYIVGPSYAAITDKSMVPVQGKKLVINPGVDLSKFNHSRWHADKPPQHRPVIGFLARLEPEKASGLFIKMVPHLADLDADFVIVGTGALADGLPRIAKAYGVDSRIQFMGSLYDKDLVQMMSRMTVIVNPSQTASETFCIANIEAMAMGVPVVSFGAGGILEYLENGYNGILVDSITPEGLAEGVKLALRSHVQLSAGAVATAQRFSTEKMVSNYVALL